MLLQRPDTLGWSVLSLAGAGVSVTLFWLVVMGVGGDLSWPVTSFVLAASYVAGAISLIPGGIGAAEASVVGLLRPIRCRPRGGDRGRPAPADRRQGIRDPDGLHRLCDRPAPVPSQRPVSALRPSQPVPPAPASLEPVGV